MSEATAAADAAPPTLPAAVRKQSAAAKVVYLVLRDGGPLTYRELVTATGQGERTLRRAVGDLREAGVVESVPAATADAAPTTKAHRVCQSGRAFSG
jgi:DNA-binding transcriptional ArsR family regulator